MMREILLGSVLLVAAAIAARADETGLASIHEWRKEGGKICLSDHFHDGAGSGETRKAAEAKAIASWMSFTDLEYGSTWASYQLSGSKKMECTERGAKEWSCAVTARACKQRGGKAKKAAKAQ
jgi:hypothetical protein